MFTIAAVIAFSVLLWAKSYLLAVGTLLLAALGLGAYGLGESSDLPGTTGRGNKNIRT